MQMHAVFYLERQKLNRMFTCPFLETLWDSVVI